MGVPMPPVIVLIVCRVLFVGEPDTNDGYTGHRNTEWDIKHGMMQCRREEIQLYDPAGEDSPMPFNQNACNRAIISESSAFDRANADRPWRFWRGACPTATVNEKGEVVGWSLPDCGHRDTVVCDNDTVI